MSKELQLLVISKEIKGTPFVGLTNYENSKGEISNQTIQVGVDIEKVKLSDIRKIEDFDIYSYDTQFNEALRIKAHAAILKSASNPSENHSKGQSDNFITLAPGIQLHKDSSEMYIVGFSIAKTVLKEGVYKHVNSQDLTLCKDEMKKKMNLKMSKYRRFVLKGADNIKTQGFTL